MLGVSGVWRSMSLENIGVLEGEGCHGPVGFLESSLDALDECGCSCSDKGS